MITIALVDDHPVVRHGIRALIESDPQLSVIVEEGSGASAVDAIGRKHPDVVLLDLTLPDMGGFEVLRRVRSVSPATRVLIVTMHAGDGYVAEALRHGAIGYVLKSTAPRDLLQAVHETAHGRPYFSPAIDDQALMRYTARAGMPLDLYDTLTPREREVLVLAAESLNNTLIGERLGISPRTVETHRFSFLRKLGLRTQTDLVRFALKRGILPPD